MREKIKRQVFLLFLLPVIAYACDYINDSSSFAEDRLLLEEAQKWYQENKADPSDVQFLEEAPVVSIKPDWKHAMISRNETYAIVETPILSDMCFGFIDLDCEQKFEETNDNRYLETRSGLVIRKNLETNQTDGFIMTITPSVSYCEATDFRPFRNNTYLFRDKQLDGYVLYHDLNGKFVNGWQYVAGVAYSIDISEKDFDIPGFRSTCYMYIAFSYTEWIQGGYATGSIAEGTFEYTITLTSHIVHVYSFYCDGGNPGAGGYNPPGSGSGPGNGNATVSSAVSNIALKVSLNADGIGLLNEVTQKKLQQCAYQLMNAHLMSYNGKFSDIFINASGTEGGYNPNTKALSFKDNNSIWGSFPEEFIHLFQDYYYPGGTAQYLDNGHNNIEFEAKLLVDLLNMINSYQNPNETGGFGYLGGGSQYKDYYIKWLDALLIASGNKIPSLLDLSQLRFVYDHNNNNTLMCNYWTFLNDFNAAHGNYPVNNSLDPFALQFLSQQKCLDF